MKRFFLFASLILTLALFAGCSADKKTSTETIKKEEIPQKTPIELTVSAAVSLTDTLEEIKSTYEKEHNVTFTFNLAGSGTLAQQIQQGAPVDVFISANQEWMDTIEEEDLISKETRQDVTGNSIVMIAAKDSTLDYKEIADIQPNDLEQVAIGNPESVPAGKYTQEILEHLKLWDVLEPKFVRAKDVRQVLTYVETGNTTIGFVYESDALISDKIKILATADPDSHEAIIYPAAVMKDSKHQKEAIDFITFLESEAGQSILGKYGFKK